MIKLEFVAALCQSRVRKVSYRGCSAPRSFLFSLVADERSSSRIQL